MLAAPFAAINFENMKDLKKTFQSFSDKIYYGEVLPPVGSLSLSYSKFLDLLEARQVKRITILADGKVALVEVSLCSRLPKRRTEFSLCIASLHAVILSDPADGMQSSAKCTLHADLDSLMQSVRCVSRCMAALNDAWTVAPHHGQA